MQVLVIAVLLKIIMRRRFSIIQVLIFLSTNSLILTNFPLFGHSNKGFSWWILLFSPSGWPTHASLLSHKMFIFSLFLPFMQWEALALLLIGISVNQLRPVPEGASSMGLPVATVAYVFTGIFVGASFCCIFSIDWFFNNVLAIWFIHCHWR